MKQMPSYAHQRAHHLGLLALAVCTSAALAQGLPPTQPTTLPSPIAATPVSSSSLKANRAEVTYTNGLLNVRANNSSLHQVLRSISRATGMTITGGIADERVFGDYGPAAPSTVLATLLGGMGTNILLRDGDASRPMELVLTPRTGGATPPSAATAIPMDADDTPPNQPTAQPTTQNYAQPANLPTNGTILPGEDPRAAARRLGPPPSNGNPNIPTNQNPNQPTSPQPALNVNGSPSSTTPTASEIPTTNSVSIDSVATPTTTPPASQGIVDSPNPAAAVSPNSPASTGPKTPDQIYQQLLQMQKKQQQTPPAQPTTPPGGPSI